ncbi:hypothetical protein I3842_04G053400 [Carya illinoinensis]|uniref:Rapid ALkalinization Factor n=1 Tax=Carya illinoinensis TaxID=32201 RepID=A0A922JQI4_CARIL|nr:hypothetical protein I3842_04G053400 [Carya illinoinensis]
MVGGTAKSGGANSDHRILAIILVMILLHKSHCGASDVAAADASIFQDNVTSLNYQGHIIDMDEPHQWFDSEISRMLAANSRYTGGTSKKSTPVSNCGRGKKYISCEPLKSQSGSIGETCGSYYKRNC